MSGDLEARLERLFLDLGLSEAAAKTAADGHDGGLSRRLASGPDVAQAENQELIRTIEALAQRQLQSGVVARRPGETRERVALHDAAWRVVSALPDGHKLRTAAVIEARWPGLLGIPAPSGTASPAASRLRRAVDAAMRREIAEAEAGGRGGRVPLTEPRS